MQKFKKAFFFLHRAARHLIECTIDDVLIREIVMEEFQHLPRVLKGLPKVVNKTVDQAKKKLARADDLMQTEMAKITDVLKLIRHAPKHNRGMAQYILQLAETPDDWCKPEERIRRLSLIAEYLPHHAGEFLSTLAKACDDEDFLMHNSVRKALDGIKPDEIVISAMSILPAYKVGASFFFAEHAFTFDLLSKRKRIPFVLHTTFSKEVGKWVKMILTSMSGLCDVSSKRSFPD